MAKGYSLSDHILQRAIEIDSELIHVPCRMSTHAPSLLDKQGISKRFLDYMRGLDTTVGQKALGSDQTVSGRVQSTLQSARTRAKTIDEQKGYSKVAHEVSRMISTRMSLTHDYSTTQRRSHLHLESLSSNFTLILQSKFATFMKRLVVWPTNIQLRVHLRPIPVAHMPPVPVRPDLT